jgi:glycosyltransferase involved in cell wall biosynthesis
MQSGETKQSVRMLIAANVPEMFRDFLNPFGNHFRREGWRVDAIARDLTESSSECQNSFDNLWDINWSRNPWGVENLQAPKLFRQTVEAVGYDIVHVHTPVPAFLSRCAMARLADNKRPRMVYTVHGFHFHDQGSLWKNQAFLGLEKLGGRWTDCLIVINRADEEAARRHKLVPDHKIVYMPGIGIERKDYNREAVSESDVLNFRRTLQVGPRVPLLLMLAEFSPGKRHRDALRAVARMKHHEAHLVLAGEGPLVHEMTTLAKQLGVADRVHFVGFRRDVPVLLRSASLSLLPSEREGLPKSIMEALNMCLPVVGTNVRGIRDLLAEGAGKLVPLGDTEQLAAALDWVLDHADESRRMGEKGQLRLGLYEREHILDLHRALYAKLLDRQSPQ